MQFTDAVRHFGNVRIENSFLEVFDMVLRSRAEIRQFVLHDGTSISEMKSPRDYSGSWNL
jgi:hypothetical protein